MNKIIYLFLILVFVSICFLLFFKIKTSTEGYSNFTLDRATGQFPDAQTKILVQDIYPIIGKNELSNNNSENIWWHYPVFELGSFKQITNNIQYPNNPDEGTCMPASMCGALYNDKKIKNNYTYPLPQINPNCGGTRVGYFDTNTNLLSFRSNSQNILY
jgi:hypothetical protein